MLNNTTLTVDGMPAPPYKFFHFTDDFAQISLTSGYKIAGDATIAPITSNQSGFRTGGWAALPTSAGTDNHEAYVGMGTLWTPAAGKKAAVGCRLALTEANTDDANIIFGWIDGITTDLLVDNGAGPKVSSDQAVFYKVDGGVVWNATTSKATGAGTNRHTDTSIATFTSGTIYELWVVYEPAVANQPTSTFHYWLAAGTGALTKLISHTVTTGTATSSVTAQPTAAMSPVFGVKNGGANVETLYIDWLKVFVEK